MTRFWSPVVHTLSPYVPGEQPKEDGIVKLNTNENPYPPSPRVEEAIAGATDSYCLQNRAVYSDDQPAQLQELRLHDSREEAAG